MAWIKRGRPSSDPTPHLRLVHRLMLNDSKRDIAYLARPCQYIQNQHCRQNFWTFDRFSAFSIDLLNEAIDNIKKNGGYKQIELVGYSGGATMALLLAAARNDIQTIRTIAGNLSPVFTNQLHKVSEMPDALEPARFSTKLESIPQIHFYGTEDLIIPASISKHYLQQFNTDQCIDVVAVKADHQRGWAEQWPALLERTPRCRFKKQTQRNP